MTISEIKTCKAQGMSATDLMAHLAKQRAAQARADEMAVLRAYEVLPEYRSERT